jgi:hypothetical protein
MTEDAALGALSDHVRKSPAFDVFAPHEISERLIFVYKLLANALGDGADSIEVAQDDVSWRGRSGLAAQKLSFDMRPSFAQVLARDMLLRGRVIPGKAQADAISYRLDDSP